MASTYTTNSGIEKPGTGEQSGLWGDTVNLNMDIIDRLTNGVGAISLSGTTHTLTVTDGALSDGQFKVLVLGGAPSGTNTITVAPNDADRWYIVKNSSGESAIFTQGSGGNVTVLNGDTKIIYCDGAGAGAEVVDVTNDFAMGSVNIDGGTIDGVTLGTNSAVTEAQIDNININGNTISTTDTNGNLTLDPNGTGLVLIPATSTEVAGIELGIGRSGNGNALIDLVGDATYSDFGLRVIRGDTGANAESQISHRGTGALRLNVADAGAFAVDTDSQERLRIDSSGNVGIGTSSPNTALNVIGDIRLSRSASASDAALNFGTANNYIYGGNSSNIMAFAVNGSERMRLSPSGELTVGTSSPSNSALLTVAGTVSASLNGRIYSLGTYNNTTASAANMHIATDGHMFRSTSSLKYKTDVQDAKHGLSEIMLLRPVTYKGKNDGDLVYGGLIAEEVHDAGLTEFVQYAEDGSPDALAYGNMVSLCVKAIQEQQAIIEALEARVAALEGN